VLSSIAPTFVGLDVHKDPISVALLRPGRDDPDQERIPNTPEEVRRLVGRWADPASVRACYEAGPCGYERSGSCARWASSARSSRRRSPRGDPATG